MSQIFTANKWYPHYKGPNRTYTIPYPTPQSILRLAVGATEYKFVSETVTSEHIRAAVIMPHDVPFQHLLSDEPWGMSYREEDWRMIIVSTLDPLRWIELSRASGAIAWLRGHAKTYTYNWEPPATDHTGNKIRPPNAMGLTAAAVDGKKYYKKKYDVMAVIDDLKRGYLNQGEIADRHDITRATVQSIARRAGLRVPRKKKEDVTT